MVALADWLFSPTMSPIGALPAFYDGNYRSFLCVRLDDMILIFLLVDDDFGLMEGIKTDSE